MFYSLRQAILLPLKLSFAGSFSSKMQICISPSSSSPLYVQLPNKGCSSFLCYTQRSFCFSDRVNYIAKRNLNQGSRNTCSACCFLGVTVPPSTQLSLIDVTASSEPFYVNEVSHIDAVSELIQSLVLADLDPATAKLTITFLGPFLSVFAFLFIVRIVMSWYPKLPVGKFPYVLAYAPTEPILSLTRKVIPPLGGVDVTPVVWFGLVSFLNEILVGPQGLLVLLSQQV